MVSRVPVRRRRPREEATWELVRKRNSIERLKEEKFPLNIVDELPQLIAMGYEAVPEEDIVRLNWWGLTHDKPKTGTFMVRIKVPGGLLAPDQLRGVGRIAQEWGRDYGELTTRQGLQLHWVRLDELPAVLDAVRATGLTTTGGEGDTVRNITGCPVAGIGGEELFDVRPTIAAVAEHFTGNPEYSNLPRKHKYTISACPAQCNAPEISNVALIGVIKDGREGYALTVGGGLSNTPRIARDLGVFVPVDEAVEVLAAVTDAWQHDLRYRVSRAKARIKFMVDDLGADGMRARVEERLGRRLEDHPAPDPVPGGDHLGVHRQGDDEHLYAGFSIPMGWMSGTQMIAVADLVEEIGGDIRLTRQQDLIVGDIHVGRLGRLVEGMREVGFPINRNKVYGNSIACTSHRFCNYSVAETKGKLDEVLAELDTRYGEAIEDLKIYMDGCPHSCAHHWVGDIGLQGTTAPDPASGTRVEAYDVSLRGGLGTKAAIGTTVLRRVVTDDLVGVLDRLVGAWLSEQAARNGDGAGRGFRDFCDEHSDDELRALGLGEIGTDDVVGDTGHDLAVVRVPGTLLHLADGVDEIEVAPATVREILARLHASYPRLTAELLREDGSVNPVLNLYVGEDDIRSLGGLDAAVDAGEELLILPALAGG